MNSRIQHILLDIGVVLLHIDYLPSLAKAKEMSKPDNPESSERFFSLIERDPMIREYETGRISAEAFFDHFVKQTGFTGSFEDFRDLWSDIFTENRPMIEFGESLARRFPVYFLTNASDIHVPAIYDRFPSLRFFKDDAVSCYLGAVKPEASFYQKSMKKFGITPETCLFIDDRPENVEGAEAFGIRSILYTTPSATIAQIEQALAAP